MMHRASMLYVLHVLTLRYVDTDSYMYINIMICQIQTDKQTDRQTERPIDRQISR